MVVPFLRRNNKYSLYNTYHDFKPEDRKLDMTNISKLEKEEFDFIGPFIEDVAIAKIGDKHLYLKSNGNELYVKEQYIELRNFESGIAAVSNDFYVGHILWSFINKNGIEIVDGRFTGYYYKNGFIEVETYSSSNDCYNTGLLSINGNILFEPSKSTHYYIHEKYIEVSGQHIKNYESAFYNFDGIKIKNTNLKNFNYIGHIRDNRGIARLEKSGEYVIIDNDFNVIKNLEIKDSNQLGESYSYIISDHVTGDHMIGRHFYGKVCPIKKNNKWGLINYNGDFVLKPQYDFIDAFTDIKQWDSYSYGCAGVGNKINSQMKYSAINSDFQEISDFIFDEINLFEEGIASVRIEGKWGAINSMGEIIVPIDFMKINYCKNNLIGVGLGDFENNRFFGKYGLYNNKGTKITKIIYEELYILENGYTIFKKDEQYGILNNEGKEVVVNIYDNIEYVNEELLLVEKNNEKFYLSFTGREFRQKN
jgi:hypothetical protein